MVGGLFASLGMILASFATSIIHIYLCTGVITGKVKICAYIEQMNAKQTCNKDTVIYMNPSSNIACLSHIRSGSGTKLPAFSDNAESLLQ